MHNNHIISGKLSFSYTNPMKTYKTHAELKTISDRLINFDFEGKTYKGWIRVDNHGFQIALRDDDLFPGGHRNLSKGGDLYEYNDSGITNIRLYKKTLDDLEQGDIVMDKESGLTSKVLGVCGDIYFFSYLDAHDKAGAFATLEQIKNKYTLVTTDEDTDPEVLELTLQDIADKFDVDVKTIKIKEVEK